MNPLGSLKGREEICSGPLKHVWAKKVHNNKIGKISPRACEPGCGMSWRDEVLTWCSGSRHPSSLPVEGAGCVRVSAPPVP